MSVESLRTLTSFSGADLIVNFGNRVIGELQQITWAVEREKVPMFTLGSPDMRGVSRGKRGIAGSLVFAVFDRDAIYEELVANNQNWGSYAPPAMFTATGNMVVRRQDDFSRALEMADWNEASSRPATTSAIGTDGVARQINIPGGFGQMQRRDILYVDQIPPFDVTMTYANEYGQAAFQKIYDLEILNEASGINVDTVIMERAVTWLARRISPIFKGVYVGGEGLTGRPVVGG